MTSDLVPSENPPPRHVAIIMDGNGRWAKEKRLPRFMGHHAGVQAFKKLVDPAIKSGVSYVTVYAFSSENWARSPVEVRGLMSIFLFLLKYEVATLVKKEIRLHFIGNISQLPASLRNFIDYACKKTAHFTERNLVVALNYGARQEALTAIQNYVKNVQSGLEQPDELNWDCFSRYLYTANIPDPDLIIRTSGESRLSNFLSLQSAYAELYFTPLYWPDFTPEEFLKAIKWYKTRERRFGREKTSNTLHKITHLEEITAP